MLRAEVRSSLGHASSDPHRLPPPWQAEEQKAIHPWASHRLTPASVPSLLVQSDPPALFFNSLGNYNPVVTVSVAYLVSSVVLTADSLSPCVLDSHILMCQRDALIHPDLDYILSHVSLSTQCNPRSPTRSRTSFLLPNYYKSPSPCNLYHHPPPAISSPLSLALSSRCDSPSLPDPHAVY